MLNSTAFVIRPATPGDAAELRHLAAVDSQRPLSGAALIGEIDGVPMAAIGIESGRVVADPFHATAALAVHLRARRAGAFAVAHQPRLRERIRTGIRLPAGTLPHAA